MSQSICRFLPRLFALFATVLSLAACGAAKFEAGASFDATSVATQLHPGQSTMTDVQALLGAPYGTGSTMMPYHNSPRLTWTYFFDRGRFDLSNGMLDERISYLFVFFRNDRFDSYIWFSTI